jgi:ABC-type nitrate/sulfonate/bicarbonate transport system permease component
MRRLAELFQSVVIPAVLLVVWEIFARATLLPRYFSSPVSIATAAWSLVGDGELAPAIFVSLYRVYAGYLAGLVVGILLGLAAGMVRPVRDFLDPLTSFLYPIPKIAFLPVLLLTFGLGDGSKIALIGASVFFPVYIAARSALVDMDLRLIWTARNMGAGPLRVFFKVVLPAVRPQLFTGARVGLALAFVLLFAAELIGSQNGLGRIVHESEDALRFDMMLAAIGAFALLGFLSDLGLMRIRKAVLRGQLLGTQEVSA